MFASISYLDSARSVIEPVGGCGPPLMVGLELVSLLASRYEADVHDIDVRGSNDVRFTMKIPVPDYVASEACDG